MGGSNIFLGGGKLRTNFNKKIYNIKKKKKLGDENCFFGWGSKKICLGRGRVRGRTGGGGGGGQGLRGEGGREGYPLSANSPIIHSRLAHSRLVPKIQKN